MAYTSEEIQAAVERLVRSGVRRTVDTSGVRQVEIQFDDIREIVAGVFIQYPNAPYYLTMLGMDRLHAMVLALLESIDELTTKIEATGRRVSPIKDLTSLTDAENALLGLETAIGSRVGLADPSTLPAYQQWTSSSAKYLNTVGASVKENGQIVETPNQAKTTLGALFNQIMDDYGLILEYEQYLRKSPDDYTAMKLPAAVAQNVVAKARAMLEEDKADLEALSEEERLEVAKDKTLNILTAQAIVDAYVKGQKVTDALGLTGTVRPYGDEDHEATPATLTGTIPGPYGLVSYPVAGLPTPAPPDPRDNNVLTFTVEGSTVSLILPVSFLCSLVGNGKPQPQPEYDPTQPFPPVDPTDPNRLFTFYGTGEELGQNSAFRIWKQTHNVDGSPRVVPLLTPQAAGTSPKGAKYCENFTNEEGKENQWFFPAANDMLYVEQIIEGGATTRYEIPMIDKKAWPTADGRTIFEYPDLSLITVPPYPDCQDWSGYKVQLTLQQVIDKINAVLDAQGSYLKAYVSSTGGIEIRGRDQVACLVDRLVGVRIPKVVVNTVETNTAAQNPLGFVLGLEMMSRRTTAMSIAAYVNSNTSKVVASIAAYPALPSLVNMAAWTNAADGAGVILAKYTGMVDVQVSGATATFTLGVGFDHFSTYALEVGDVICLPLQYVNDNGNFVQLTDCGARYVITSVSDTVLTASHSSGPVAVAYPLRMIDAGLNDVLANVYKYNVVQIFTAPNEGAYEINSIDTYSPFRVSFGQLLSQSKQASEPLPIQLDVTLGPAACAFSSADLTPASSILVAGSCMPVLFAVPPTTARGTTPYVQIESDIKVSLTDKLSFWDGGTTRYTRQVTNVEDKILTLDSYVRSDLAWAANASVAPSCSMVSGPKQNADTKAIELEAWESKEPTDPTLYQQNMNAKLNPLLENHVPAAGRINDAKAGVAELQSKVEDLGALSEVQLTGPQPDSTPAAFYVEPIPAVDDMLVTLKTKGCDRAVDLLLMGRFSEFFGLDMDEMSYVGAMMKAARDVARNDLAVSRFGASRIRRKVLSMATDSDPDYDHSDSDAMPGMPDATSGFDLPSTPDEA